MGLLAWKSVLEIGPTKREAPAFFLPWQQSDETFSPEQSSPRAKARVFGASQGPLNHPRKPLHVPRWKSVSLAVALVELTHPARKTIR